MNRKKNVVIILSDEQRWDTLGRAGVYPFAQTPNLDRLAAEGSHFTHCYTPCPLCCPARASLWTGLAPHSHHVVGNWRAIRPDLAARGLPRHFGDAGYHTLYVGKWHVPGTDPRRFHFNDSAAIPGILDGCDKGRFIPPYRQYAARRGYDLLPGHIENLTVRERASYGGRGLLYGRSEIPYEDYLEMWVTRQLFEALDRRPDDKPFFAVVSYSAPHFPMIVPAPFDTVIPPRDDILPANFLRGIQGKPREAVESNYFRGRVPERQWKEHIAHYHGFCAMVDDLAGRVIQRLKEIGEWDRTVLVFASDHGDMMGSHGMFMKGFPIQYEETCRVPLIVRDPDGAKGSVSNGFVTLADLVPTLAELCGVRIGEEIEGLSFASNVADSSSPPIREYALSEAFKFDGHENGHGEHVDPRAFGADGNDSVNLSLRTAEGRYMFRYNDSDEYYDEEKDPGENDNVAARPEYSARVAACRKTLLDALENAPPAIVEAVAARLREKAETG